MFCMQFNSILKFSMFTNLGVFLSWISLEIWIIKSTTTQMNLSLYGISVLDCSEYLPLQVLEIMQEYQFDSNSTSNISIPQRYLQDCLNKSHYNKYLAPYEFSAPSKMWSLNVGMAVSHLINLDAFEDLQLKVNVGFQWNDPRLQWNASTNLSRWKWPTKTYVPSSRLWTPEITVLTCELSSCSISIDSDTLVDISNDGTVEAHDSLLLSSNCLLDFTYFPFDNQTCVVNMLIDFPGDEESRIQIHTSNAIETDYVASNEEWDLTSVDFFSTTSMTYQFQEMDSAHWVLSRLPVSNHSLVLVVCFKRTASYYMDNVIGPLVVLVLIGVFVVFLPPDAIERSEYTLTVVLAFVFYKTTLTTMQPVSNRPPLIGTYINTSFALLAAFLVTGVLVLRLWRRDPTESAPPLILRFLFIRSTRWLIHVFKTVFIRRSCLRSNKGTTGNQLETAVTPPDRTDECASNESRSGPSGNSNWPFHYRLHKERPDRNTNANYNNCKDAHTGVNATAADTQLSGGSVPIPSGTTSYPLQEEPSRTQTGVPSNMQNANGVVSGGVSQAAANLENETWHTLALYVHVWACIAFVLANIALFCVYMVPLFVIGLRNNATPLYYNISSK